MARWTGILCVILAVPLFAATTVFDFEDPADATGWHDEKGTACRNFPVSREANWATSGEHSLCFRTPKWKPGMGEWPACEITPPVTDWSGYDRLVLDVTNPTDFDQRLSFFITDSVRATRTGLNTRVLLPPGSYRQAVVKLADVVKMNVKLKDIHTMHFFTERPAGDMEVYMDRMILLRPDEPLPTPGPDFVKALAGLQQDQIVALHQAQEDVRARIAQVTAQAPGVAVWADRLMADNDARVTAFAEQVRRGDPVVLKAAEFITQLRADTARLESLVSLRAGFESVRQSVQAPGSVRDDVVVGFATSMEKVLPRAGAPDLQPSIRASLALARNEKEALQVIVMPVEDAARQVQVRVRDLRGPGGAIFSSDDIAIALMGYVETKSVPPYGSSHVGWWPDPILGFMSKTDIAEGDAQSFWVRLNAPKSQAPGMYRGALEVLVEGRPLYVFELSVRVYPFTLPDRSPLNMAVTFFPRYNEAKPEGGWRGDNYRDTSWRKHKLEWGDFLADYYITYDSLYAYGGWSPDFEVLQRLHEQGRLGTFNLGYYSMLTENPEQQKKWKADVRKRIGEPYKKAKALGLLDHAYIYGCDEHPKDKFPGVERAAAFLRKEFPGAFILTTTYDHSFGTDSVLQSMDGFCPLTPRYKRDLADKVRATGKEVWWYICCGPRHPYCNMFIEYPAIEGRLLMGAQTAKYRPDGFLYYQTSIWNGKQIRKGPFTDWDPRSWTTFHGDGSWTCLGPDGTPLPTIRLENFRDGVEDYAYARLLEKAIAQVEGNPELTVRQRQWLVRAKSALRVPDGLSRSMTEYTDDPADVYRWRRGMAKALATSGVNVSLP